MAMNKTKFYANEKRDEIFAKAGWRCQVCNRWLKDDQPQLAHRVPATKANLKKWSKEFIHHEFNLVPVCSAKCNSSVLISQFPMAIDDLMERIAQDLAERQIYGID